MKETNLRCLVGLLLLIALGGCSTYSNRLVQIRDAYYSDDLETARERIAESLDRKGGDADVLSLELAMVTLAQGNASEAESLMREVRGRFDQHEGLDAGEVTLSYWTDDQRRAYAGEAYERVLVRAFLALSNLLHDGTDAEAYSLQMIEKQEQIIEARKKEDNEEQEQSDFPRVALAPYLRGILREATHRDYEDAERSFATVVNWQPEFAPGPRDVQRALHGRHSQRGNGVLYLFALTGRGPYKEEVVQAPSSGALLVAGEIVSAVGEQTVPPNVAPVKVPRVVARPSGIDGVAVGINGQSLGRTATITDVTALAIAENEAVFDQIVARAVARRILKKGVVYGAKEAADLSKGSFAAVAVDLAGVAWEATESADTRCWGLLPDKIQVLRVELPAGKHDVDLLPIPNSGRPNMAHRVRETVSIADGRNTYMLATFPDQRLVGKVVVSR